jgi:cobalt-zinc-cadmium efflux system protein
VSDDHGHEHGHDHDERGHSHGGGGHEGHAHGVSADADVGKLAIALGLLVSFMLVEVVIGIVASSLALLSDAGHMLTDAAALALSIVAIRLAARPAKGVMTFGLKRVEILSAQANGLTLLILAVIVLIEAIRRLFAPPDVEGGLVLGVALLGVVVNIAATWTLAKANRSSLNVEGAFKHVLTDLYAFIGTAIAGAVILITGFDRADAIASLLIAGLMLNAAYDLLKASGRVFMEAAPAGLDPAEIGHALASHPGVVEVHDLHVWEVTSGFAALSAHVVVRAGDDCHELRRSLESLLHDRFHVDHTTLQVDHEAAPLQIQVTPSSGAH